MAVVPEFNPNIFSKYRPYQWRNRTVTDCFEPGSIMKAFLLAACLEEHIVTPDTMFDCEQGEYKVGAHVIHDAHKYSLLSVSDIVMYSSNIGAIKIGQEFGYAAFCNYLGKFGFGARTGIDLLGERKGFIRRPEHAKTIDQATLFFGQGMTSTSLQIAMAAAAIANGGKLMRPYVVKAIINESGRTIEETHPRIVRRVIQYDTAKKVAKVLQGVTSDQGTAPQAAIRGFAVAGKTGTSQKVDPGTNRYSRRKFVYTFVGFVPADQPRLVILVVIDEPQGSYYGGVVAAPVFRDVAQWSLNYLRVNPQTSVAWVTDGETDAQEDVGERVQAGLVDQVAIELKTENSFVNAGCLPDFRGLGMREVVRKTRSLGLKVFLEGTGLAVKQHPKPGFSLDKVATVKVSFRPPT